MRSIRVLVAFIALLAAPLMHAHAQSYPSKPVKIVVPYPPGGAVDVVTRKMAAKLQEQTGQTFFVENKAGGTGTIGIMSVVNAPADGYTLVTNDTTYSLLPNIFKKLPFDHQKDLAPVSAFVFAPMAVVVKTDSKFKTLADLLAAAKAAPNTITYGTGGAGSLPHFASEALGIAGGAKFMHVPFKGAGEATMALLSGTIDFQMASTPGVISQVKGGKVRLLGVSGDKRPVALAEFPTFNEAGLKGFGVVNFTGLWAPKGTPVEVVKRLETEIAKAMATPDMKAYSEGLGGEAGHMDGATLGRAIVERTAYWGKVAANSAFEKQ